MVPGHELECRGMKFKAVLFDLDGTLIHTTHLYEEACIVGMRAIGLDFSAEDFRRLYPQSMGMRSWISEKGGDPDRLDEVRAARDLVYHELLATRTEFCPGALDLLKFLEKHPTGVITNSWRSYLDAIHKCLGLYDHVTQIVTADEMGDLSKPHPHGLLLTADKLGVDPEDCVYVGDQIFDLHAAKAAGMQAYLVHGSHTPKHGPDHADHVLESLDDLTRLLRDSH